MCCNDTKIESNVQYTKIESHTYKISIVYCTTCGQVKATSNILHEK